MNPIKETIEAIKEGRNIAITGGAGVGKSYTLRHVIEWCEEEQINVARTAMTGMASLQFEFGETLHRCFGIGMAKNVDNLRSVTRSYKFRNETRWELEALDLIIIDEKSMLRSDLLELCDAILKYVMENDEPFGGKQVILSGDFMQLPPIVKPEERASVPKPWAFQSPVWNELNLKIIYLTEIKRQDDPRFCMALNMIRAGAVNDAVDEYFFNTYKHKFPDGIEPVKLLSTNLEVNRVNQARLDKIFANQELYKARVGGSDQKTIEKLRRDCPAKEELNLKVGAQVMILVNDSDYRYVNGSVGVYEGMSKTLVTTGRETLEADGVKVKITKTGETVVLPKNEWKIEKKGDDDKRITLASFKQFPIKLAWAITVHKSQGMTLDYLEVDLTRCFAEGMAYVALSRARTYEGLKIINWRPGAVKCNKDAFNFYMNLKNKGVI